jgi:hypothetical protein
MNCTGYGRNRINMNYHPSICLDGCEQSTKPVPWPKFEPQICRIRSRSADHSVAAWDGQLRKEKKTQMLQWKNLETKDRKFAKNSIRDLFAWLVAGRNY